MKDRIVFFMLGAMLATAAYFIGDMDNLSADDGIGGTEFDTIVVEKLYVKDKLVVSEYVESTVLLRESPCVVISADRESASISITSTPNTNSRNRDSIYITTGADGGPGIRMQNSKGVTKIFGP